MQSLCMLRNHCHQWPRNTRYQADATPYLGRTFTGWIAPALRLAHLFDHFVSTREQRRWHSQAEGLGSLEIECAAERHEKKRGQQHELKKNVSYSCVKDEGGPLGIVFERRVPNHSKRLRSKAVVVSVGTKVRGIRAGVHPGDERKQTLR